MIVKIFRYDPETNEVPYYDNYEIQMTGEAITLKALLEKIARDFDPSLAFLHHSACNHSSCKRCFIRIDGKPALACTTLLSSEKTQVQIDPVNTEGVVRDLVVKTI